jgi:hypothetical protein
VCASSVAESSTVVGVVALVGDSTWDAPEPAPALPAGAPLRLLKNWPIMSGTGRMPPSEGRRAGSAGAGGAAEECLAGSDCADDGQPHDSQPLPGSSGPVECEVGRRVACGGSQAVPWRAVAGRVEEREACCFHCCGRRACKQRRGDVSAEAASLSHFAKGGEGSSA